MGLLPLLLLGCAAVGRAATGRPATHPAQSPADGCGEPDPWPLWEAYRAHFITSEGRVIDHTGGGHSTSEGQAYAMVLSLIAGDRQTFERVLRWATDNLAGGDLAETLPAWKWGRLEPGEWGVADPNPASDADLWMAYALIEAGRSWEEPAHGELGRAIAANVAEREVADLPGLGPMLLPAPEGFVLDERTWRLNPSYLPLQVLDGLAASGARGPWARVREGAVEVLRASAAGGFVPDWIAYREGSGFLPDPVSGPVGSHDAIRTYLWASTLHDDAADKAAVCSRLLGMVRHFDRHGTVPERVDAFAGEVQQDHGPVGFLGVLLPELEAVGDAEQLGRLRAEIELYRNGELYGSPPTYYDQNLLLFATGFDDGRYRFGPAGRLHTSWEGSCDEP